MPRARGMDAVYEKSQGAMSKRTPMLKRKPTMSVMIAVGKPKGPPMGKPPMDEDEEEMEDAEESVSPEILLAKIRTLTKRLEALEAQMNGESEEKDESEDKDEEEY